MKNYLLALLLASGIHLAAQPELGECDQEVEEVAQDQLPRALANWKKQNYREVERYLKRAISLDEDYADALYLLGDFYVRKRQMHKTIPLWKKLLEVCPAYKAEVRYFLGSIMLEEQNFDQAIELLEGFLNDPERDMGFDAEVKSALAEARMKKNLLANPIPFEPRPVRRISTMADEYLASISPDQKLMFFTRRSKKVNRKDGPAAKVRLVEEFSLAQRLPDGQFEEGKALPEPFNTSYNEGGPSITADNTELYFTVCQDIKGYQNCDIYYSEKNGFGEWTVPRSVGDHINLRDAWESQPAVSANGDALYFASNRPGGKGDLDLYVCYRGEDGAWSAPKNLGRSINTSGNEKTPFIHSDSHTLYFTSDGHNGLGGYDIYFARAHNDTAWEKPQNIGYPINSEGDDLSLFVSLDGATAYFASNKFSKANGWDIYSFALPDRAKPEEVTLITGSLTDEYGDPVEDGGLEIKNLETNEVTKVKVDKETGAYARVVETKPGQDLIVTVKKKGLAFSSRYVDVGLEQRVVEAPLKAEKLELGREYELNDINFESNSYELDEISRSVIDEFIIFLEENPSLRAEIQGHTDNVGRPEDNMVLSRQRARTVYQYALDYGVAPERLQFNGYGETRPVQSNTTEEGRADNRRTVFVITSK